MTRRFDIGPVVLGLGAILVLVSLFLDWYEGPPGDGISGFTVFEFLDLLLTGLAVVMLVSLADAIGLVRSGMRSYVPLVVAALAAAVGLLTPDAEFLDRRAVPWIVGATVVLAAARS